jgi:hypothetical protein
LRWPGDLPNLWITINRRVSTFMWSELSALSSASKRKEKKQKKKERKKNVP